MRKEKNSVYKVTMLYLETAPVYPARLSQKFLGYYTSLKEAVLVFRRQRNGYLVATEGYFKVFEVEEYFLNTRQYEASRSRTYDEKGKFYDEYNWKVFKGIEQNDCKFQQKEMVEYLQYFMEDVYLNIGMITALPPTPQQYKQSYKGLLLEADHFLRILTRSGKAVYDDQDRWLLSNEPGITSKHPAFIFTPAQKVSDKLKKDFLQLFSTFKKKGPSWHFQNGVI